MPWNVKKTETCHCVHAVMIPVHEKGYAVIVLLTI